MSADDPRFEWLGTHSQKKTPDPAQIRVLSRLKARRVVTAPPTRTAPAPTFVIELHSRRVHLLGSTSHPDEAFVVQTMRALTDDVDGVLRRNRMLICDRDRKWSAAVERFLGTAGVRVIRTPFLAPNCNAHAERFVRSVREECLNRIIPLGERHLRRTLADFVAHYHGERNTRGSTTS